MDNLVMWEGDIWWELRIYLEESWLSRRILSSLAQGGVEAGCVLHAVRGEYWTGVGGRCQLIT